nr:helix-turn-helix domain-containing protein [Actinomycetota bacterium]
MTRQSPGQEPAQVRTPRAHVMRSQQAAGGPTPDLALLGAFVRLLRTERKMSTRVMAQRALCARWTIQRLERGELRPRRSLLVYVATALDPDRHKEIRAVLIQAAGGPDALAADGRWSRRRARRAGQA